MSDHMQAHPYCYTPPLSDSSQRSCEMGTILPLPILCSWDVGAERRQDNTFEQSAELMSQGQSKGPKSHSSYAVEAACETKE